MERYVCDDHVLYCKGKECSCHDEEPTTVPEKKAAARKKVIKLSNAAVDTE